MQQSLHFIETRSLMPYLRSRPIQCFFENRPSESDIPHDMLDLPLSHGVHKYLCKIDAWIASNNRILCAGVGMYPVENPIWSTDFPPPPNNIGNYFFLKYPKCFSLTHPPPPPPPPNVSMLVVDLESLCMFLFGLDKAFKSLHAVANGCLVPASKASNT